MRRYAVCGVVSSHPLAGDYNAIRPAQRNTFVACTLFSPFPNLSYLVKFGRLGWPLSVRLLFFDA